MLSAFSYYAQQCDQCLGLGGDAMGLPSFPVSSFGMLETKGVPIL